MHRLLLTATGIAAAIAIVAVALPLFLGRSSVGGPPDGVSFTSERHGYTVVLPIGPDGWIREERSGTWELGDFIEANSPAGLDYFEDRNEDGSVALFAYLASQPIPETMSFEEWAAGHDAANAEAQPSFVQQGSFEGATVGGETARVGIHRGDYQGGFDAGGSWTTVQVLLEHGGRGYAIYFWPGPGPGSEVPLADLQAMATDWLSRFSFTN